MAESRFKGLSILMNMRDVGIDRTMKQIRAQFKTLDSEMRRSNANFKHSEKNMQSYATRTKELTKAIDVTENSMKDISNQLKKMTLEEQRSSVEAEKLRQEYSKQHRALQMYQRQLNSTEQEMKQFGTTTKQTIFSMKKINDVLGTMKRQLNIANMAFQSTEKSTSSYKNYLNQLNTVIQKHQNTIRVLEGRYQKIAREQGVMSKEALELKEKILQEKATLGQLDNQYKKTTMEAKRFAFEQKTLTASMSEIRQKMSQVAQSLTISANKFKMSGQTAQAYKARISELNNGMKQQQLIVQNLSRQYDFAKKQYGATSQEAQQLNIKLSEERLKLKELNTQLNQTTQAHNRLEMEQKQGISSMTQIRAKMSQFNDTLSLSRSNLARAGESVKAYGSHLNALKTNMSEQRVVLRELIAQYNHVATAQGRDSQEARELSSAITQQKIKMNELESELDQTTQSYKRLETEQRNAERLSSSGFGRSIQSVNKYKESINNVGSSMRNVGSNMSLYFTLPVVAGFGAAIKTGADFEQQMARVGAIAGSSKTELKSLSDQAVDLGAKTSLSASEVAKGMEELAALGMSTNQIMKAMPGVISAAEASGSDLATTASIMASSLNSFNLKANDSSHVADLLATAANDSAADIQYMGEALKYASTPAHALGITLEDTSAAIEVMSNSGLDGSQAGTALRASFIRLAKPTNQSQKAIDKLGISLTNSKGKFVGMPNLIGQFKNSLQGMTKEQKLAYVAQIVGTEAASGFLSLIDAGPDKIKKYSDSLKDSNGASKDAADKMKDNLKGSLEQLQGAFESLGITIGKAFSPALRKLADVVTALVSKFSSLPTPVIVITTLFVGLVASIGPLLMLTGLLAHSIVGISEAMKLLNDTKSGAKFFSLFNGGIKGVLPNIGQLLTKIPLIGGLMTTLTGPVGIAVAAIAGIGTAFVVAYKKSETFRNIVNSVIEPVINSFKKMWGVVKTIFEALKKLLSGNFLPTLDLLSKIMPKETATKLTMRLLQIRQLFVDAFNSIFDFVKEIGKKLTDFWAKNGDTVIQALKNIGNFFVDFFVYLKDLIGPNLRDLGNLVQSIFMNILVPVIKGAMNIILGIMKFVWPFIKVLVVDTWNNIKNIIRAALDVILGIVKIFSGIFTGQWKLVWEGVKQVFKGALVLIWNLIQLWFIGKILKVVKIFGGFFKSVISKSFNGVKNIIGNVLRFIWNIISTIFRKILSITQTIFGAVRRFISVVFHAIKNVVVNSVKAIFNGVKRWFTAVKNITHTIFSALKQFIYKIWTSIKNKVVSLAKALSNGVKNIFNSLSKVTRSIFNKLKSFMLNVWRNIKNTVIKLAKGLWNGVKATWNALSKVTRSIFNKLKNFMSNVWRSIKNTTVKLVKGLWSGVKAIWNTLSRFTRSIFNKLKNFMSSVWRNIKNTTVRLAKALWSSVKGTWNSLSNGTRNIFNKVKSFMSNTWRSIKNTTVNMAKSLWNSVRRTFNNMAGGLKSIIGKIKGHITGMVKAVKSGLNKLIDGVNWVAGKLDMPKLPKIKLSTGTESTHTQSYITKGKLNRNTLATVGDKGPGNGPGGFRHETVIPPSGKAFITPATDTTIPLAKGTRILNGEQTHAMLSNNMVPKFSIGTKIKEFGANMFDSGKSLVKKGVGKAKDIGGTVEKKTAKTVAKGIEIGTNVADTAKAVSSTVIKGIGDVFDYVSHPGKLVSKIFEKVGFNFDFLKGAELPYMLMQGAYKKLKEGVKSLFSGWLSDAGGGDGSSFTHFPITTGYYPRGGAPGYGFNSGAHFGIDYGAPYGTTINATNDGVVKGIHNFGGGLVARLLTGQFTLFFMHLSKILKEGKIKAGEPMAKTGNSGHWTTGPHLHFQVEKGRHDTITNANTVDPAKWLAGHGGGGGSAPKAGIKWAPQIKQALRMNGLPTSSAYVNAWARQIDSESSGNPRAVQGGYVDANTGGNEAKGLVQVARNTFNSMKFPGHGNVFNPLDNLLAGIHWAKYKYGKNMLSVIGHGHGYATGGLIKNAGWYNIAEGGYPEWVIPTDPSRRNDAMKMLALAAQDIDRKSSTRGNKRPNNLKTPNNFYSNNNDELLLQMIEQQQQQINLLMEIARSNRGIENKEMEVNLDGKSLNKNNNKHQALNNATRLMGGR
ncbi:phage tail tape measure protein [Staphylococcus hominis]|uniref:phage tail tape measure protein n=3 Tax=Staphylococcus hominis TaxID=1290 RepID=UPI001F58F079|nr:phage tail tape measure protein [Staphylococcus hominis]MCI2917792.1 phage tail tape measure protein [Staphylococcus hominis]MDS3925978.1 phage tail tape measure protein [Staphylococcus hominis]